MDIPKSKIEFLVWELGNKIRELFPETLISATRQSDRCIISAAEKLKSISALFKRTIPSSIRIY